ncbi:hypothetical protein FPSE_06949 [Fusarium pseudograminearum CS3096]|uniref:Uncharacterized protein n=1 Tax=Fusarium pseudograminearum (strain CS3096) TaxID=1028729 RepID=K3VIE6_FUSPC|nr:hypothetical protein FPSE_06949 [Fusarium pseudograminearum CS3096]EKJ72903.1 hypothetical protein FPSE_06949 [Fusarium pseudograminearum CS3096]
MWLLDVNSVRLIFYANEEQTPPYAILSHTWSDDEVSFQDIKSIPSGNDLATKAGWSKIEHACRLALSFGLSYVWVDTCCIDKSSSAELQEAINSMFRWYELAQICFAYLSDVSTSDDHNVKGSSFRRSRWFKRGWTLQELIAPNEVAFYDKDWKPLFTRGNTVDLIRAITGIREYFLSNQHRDKDKDICNMLSTASVAERMAWMNNRNTTRPEDLAYCLLGIFDINMPMLYGEGSKAFQRLQEEIMKKNDDSSLFGWGYQELHNQWRFEQESLLAPHPSSFRLCGDIEPCPLVGFSAPTFSMTQRGLQMEVPVRVDLTHQLLVYMILGCSPRSTEEGLDQKNVPKSFVAIPLISTSAYDLFDAGEGAQKGEYLRPKWCRPTLVSEKFLSQANTTSIVIRRPSERLGKLQKLPISIASPAVSVMQDYTILGTYPPQPIGSQLLLIQSSQHVPDVAPPPDIQKKVPVPLSIMYSKEHQIMIQINIPTLGDFVVVLGYRAVGWRRSQGMNIWQCLDIKSHVFKFPDNINIEALHTLSITQDFTSLPGVSPILLADRCMYKVGTEIDAYLEFLLTKDDKRSGISNAFISVIRPSGNCHEQECYSSMFQIQLLL